MKLTFFFKKRCLLCTAAICDEAALCTNCDTGMQALRYRQMGDNHLHTHALWRYDGLAKYFIQRLKFHEDFTVLSFLVKQMQTMLQVHYQGQTFPEVIIPVPLHFSRLFKRGFNQSHELGKALARALALPFDSNAMHKTRFTPPQATLSRQDRLQNLNAVFRLNKNISYRSVALIDDVMTTGATVREMTCVLKAGGVEEVHVWVLARAGAGSERNGSGSVIF